MKIARDELGGLAPCDTVDKIGLAFAARRVVSVNRYRKAAYGNTRSRCAKLGLGGKAAHNNSDVKHIFTVPF